MIGGKPCKNVTFEEIDQISCTLPQDSEKQARVELTIEGKTATTKKPETIDYIQLSSTKLNYKYWLFWVILAAVAVVFLIFGIIFGRIIFGGRKKGQYSQIN